MAKHFYTSFACTLFLSVHVFSLSAKGAMGSSGNPEYSIQAVPELVKKNPIVKITEAPKEKLKPEKKEIRKEVAKKKTKKIERSEEINSTRTQTAAFLLALIFPFIGLCGIQRFYLGGSKNIVIGIIQLLTFGLFAIWQIIDIVRISTGELRPPEGEYKEWK